MSARNNVKSNFSIIGLLMVLVCLSLMISGCEKSPQSSSKVIKVGIVLFGDSRLPQVEGFQKGLNDYGQKEGNTFEYIVRNVKNKRANLKPAILELLEKQVDLLVAAGGLEADTIKQVSDKKTPVLVLYVNARVERGLVNSRVDPGWNVTGVDNLNAELSGKRVKIMKDFFPDMKKILILYYKKIAPSRIGVEHAIEIAKGLGVEIDARAVSSREEIKQVMQGLNPGDVSAMLTVPTAPIDNALKEIILPEVQRLKLPLMTHSRPLAEKGALSSYGAHFYDLGLQASRLAQKILSGTEPRKIPFETPKRYVCTLNSEVQKEFDIKLSSLATSQINEYINNN